MRTNLPAIWALSSFLLAGQALAAERLPQLGASRNDVTVSGISSGGYMAGQFHLAHSKTVDGVGIIAAGPYDCAQGSMLAALGPCVKGGVAVPPLLAAARAAAAGNSIDALDGVRGDRIWLFHGTADETVSASVVSAARDFYSALTAPAAIAHVDTIAATHGVPTRATGQDCKKMASPFLNACGYDAAGEMLEFLRGQLKPAASPQGRLIEFDQSEFGDASLDATGFAYVPTACAAGAACRIHVFFHGCAQSNEVVGDTVVRGAGFNEWAESNSLVVLYPQVKSSRFAPLNPLGCWDWWGYSGAAYATREGAQIKAVKGMIDRLAGQGT